MERRFLLGIIFSLLAIYGCSENERYSTFEGPNMMDNLVVEASVPAFKVRSEETKSDISPQLSFQWSEGDRLGVFPHADIGRQSQTTPQACFVAQGQSDSDAQTFLGGNGWKFNTTGDFSYVAYYPFDQAACHDSIRLDYTGQVQSGNNNVSHLARFDYLVSEPSIPSDSQKAQFAFSHLGCIVRLEIKVPEELYNTSFTRLRIVADSYVFSQRVSYSIGSVASGTIQPAECKDSPTFLLRFADEGVKPADEKITVFFMMYPTRMENVNIRLLLYAADDSHVPVAVGSTVWDVEQEGGTIYQFPVETECIYSPYPSTPTISAPLKVLLISNSYGNDSFREFPKMVNAAGIQNLYTAHFYHGSATFKTHYDHLVEGDEYTFYEFRSGDAGETSKKKSLPSAITEKDWDYVILQTGVSDKYYYSTFQPYLNDLMDYILSTSLKVHGKLPVIGYHNTWSVNTTYDEYIDYDASSNYGKSIQATRQMMDETDIWFIVNTGTAIQNARNTSLCTPSSRMFLRDGVHMSLGIGDCIAASTWFEALMKPVYGVSILGNTYIPTSKSFPGDEVTESNITLIQRCAVAAVANPFQITELD